MRKLGLSRVFPFALQAALGLSVAMFGTGCGALGALSNPKAAFALNEPAPMSVVVRRAEVARGTSNEVERLLGDTGIDDKSAWTPKVAMKSADAEKLLKDLGAEPVYAGAQVRVIPAEAWYDTFSAICSKESKYPSLLASVTPELATAYAELAEQKRNIAEMKGKVADLDKAIDDKDQAAKKDDNQKEKQDLQDKISKAEDETKPKMDKFLGTVKEEAGKAKPEVKDRIGVAIVNLRRAVDDAKLANSVALVRYPLAVPHLKEDATASAKRILADVIEEKTGTRPNEQTLSPEVTLDGANVKLSLGASAGKLGAVNAEEVIAETTTRMKNYVGRVLTLLAYAGETQETLSFEGDVLAALSDGLKLGTGAEMGVDIGDVKVQVAAGKARKRTGTRSAVGIVANACSTKPGTEKTVTAKAEEAEPEAKPAAKGGKKGAVIEMKKAEPKKPVVVVEAKKPVVVETKKAVVVTEAKPQKPTAEVVPAAVRHETAAPAEKAPETKCDVSVTNGTTKICL